MGIAGLIIGGIVLFLAGLALASLPVLAIGGLLDYYLLDDDEETGRGYLSRGIGKAWAALLSALGYILSFLIIGFMVVGLFGFWIFAMVTTT